MSPCQSNSRRDTVFGCVCVFVGKVARNRLQLLSSS